MNSLDVWKEFCIEYDVNVLNNLSIEIKEYIKKLILQSEDNKFKGLESILLNYFFPIPIRYDIVTGHKSFHYFVGHGKKIYLFGERHGQGLKCKQPGTRVSRFIVENIKNNPRFIDLFIELPLLHREYKKIEYGRREEYELDYIEFYFKECLKVKKKCNFPNVRAHYSDVRKYKSPISTFISELFDIITNQSYVGGMGKVINKQKFIKLKNKFPNEVEEYKKLSTFRDFRNYFDSIFFPIKIQKQLDNIKDNDIKQQINEWFIGLFKDKLESFINWTIIELSITTDYALSTFSINSFIGMVTPYMDLYIVTRMFRSFNKIKYFNSNEAKNIIVYAGDAHISNYANLLTNYLKFTHVFSRSSDENFCMDLSDMNNKLLFE